MPSKMQQRIQHARDRDVWVFRMPSDWWETRKVSWGVYVDGEWSTRGPMTKRAAKNLAYAISIAKKATLTVEIFDGDANLVERSVSRG